MARRPTRSRQARRSARLDFAGLEIVGALLTPDIVARLAAFEANDQSKESYDIPAGLKLRDEIARYFRIGEALWSRFEATRGQSVAASERFVLDLLRQCFGFDSITPRPITRLGEREFPVRHAALGGRVPVVVAPAPAEGARRSGVDESLPQFGDSSRRRSATLLLQEYLNARDDAGWGLACDGVTLRLLRDNISLTRPTWIEANLSKIFSEGLFPDFSALWLLIHQSRFGQADAAVSDCALERWRDRGRIDGVTARDKLRQGVESALYELGQGFIENPANGALRQALSDGTLSGQAYFEELLRVVYRLIFLFAAEDRELLHPPGASKQARQVYAEGYSLGRLRERSMRRTAWDRHADAWEGLKATFRAVARGQERLGLPALGGLFAHDVLPNLEKTRIENRRFLAAIWRLAWLRPEGQPLTRVNWRDMETEELGSVYESLLELTPRPSADARTFEFAEGDETKGNARKTSGSYYTPDALVKLLLDSTLEPVLDAAEARSPEDPAAEILKLSIIDPACGSGHFLLGAARRAAVRIAKHRSPGAPSKDGFQHALREVVSHCIYGVDRNPMAVELCKVALWIEALEPGKPLTFLDNHIRCGDSLIGVFDIKVLQTGIEDEAYKPLPMDEKEATSYYRTKNKREVEERGKVESGLGLAADQSELSKAFAGMQTQPEDSLEDIEAKRRLFDSLMARGGAAWKLKIACDLWTAAWFAPKTEVPTRGREMAPTSGQIWEYLRGMTLYGPLIAEADRCAHTYRFFHWPVEFPDIVAKGGFDVVLGNPPWDTLSPDAKEFFSPYDGEVRFMAKPEQAARFEELRQLPGVEDAWQAYCHRIYAAAAFIKRSGRYRLFADGNLGKGDFNIYRMFVELALMGINRSGRAAQFVPENFYNGANATAIRKHLYTRMKLESLVAFENTGKIWFDIDSRAKFCLYVASRNGPTVSFRSAFGVNSTEKLAEASLHLPVEMPVSLIEEFSPESMAIAEVVHPSDISVSKKIYGRFPKFSAETDGLASRIYSREVDMGTDRELFVEDPNAIPVYEGRMVEAFDHRAKKYVTGRGRSAQWDELRFGSPQKKISPQWRIQEPDVPSKLGQRWQRYRIGFCDVGGVTNARFFMASIIPPGVVCGHSVPTIEFSEPSYALMSFWVGVANSFCSDFLARKKGANHMTYTILDSLPLPRVFTGAPIELAIAKRALRLSATGPEMQQFWQVTAPLVDLNPANDAPCEDVAERHILKAEIDVLAARDLFDLTLDEMRYVLDPSDILGSGCDFETFGALKRSEEREHDGRFFTRDLIVSTWKTLAVPKDAAVAVLAPAALPGGAWARPAQPQPGDTGAALAAILKTMDGPRPIRDVRLIVALVLEPRLIVPLLPQDKVSEWRRLVGSEAQPLAGNVAAFATRINATWGSAVQNHRGNGRLIENLQSGTWAPGAGLETIETGGWPDGRAGFVLEALRSIDLGAAVNSLPDDIQRWVADAAAA